MPPQITYGLGVRSTYLEQFSENILGHSQSNSRNCMSRPKPREKTNCSGALLGATTGIGGRSHKSVAGHPCFMDVRTHMPVSPRFRGAARSFLTLHVHLKWLPNVCGISVTKTLSLGCCLVPDPFERTRKPGEPLKRKDLPPLSQPLSGYFDGGDANGGSCFCAIFCMTD